MNESVLTLVRHGQTDWNEAGRLQGHTDVPLNCIGRRQAEQTAAFLASQLPQAPWRFLYTSDLGRARATAAPIGAALGLAPREDAALRERSLGPLEGLAYRDIPAQYPQLAAQWPHLEPELVPDGLELPRQAGQRALAWCEAAWRRHPGQNVIAVSHGGWITSLCELLGHRRPAGFRLGNCSVTTVAWGPGGGRVIRFGDLDHFDGVLGDTPRLAGG